MEFIYEPEFWVAVSFFLFIGALVYLGVHKKVASALDARALLISRSRGGAPAPGRGGKGARQLPAQAGRCGHGGRQHHRARRITALAAKQTETLAAETRQSLKEYFDRRIKLAEGKIARAEMEAVRELRSDAVDAAIAAAQNLITATPARANKLVSASIKAL